jgi:hypothetical protein
MLGTQPATQESYLEDLKTIREQNLLLAAFGVGVFLTVCSEIENYRRGRHNLIWWAERQGFHLGARLWLATRKVSK